MTLMLRPAIVAITLLLLAAASAFAGGGPENVLLLVNSRSAASRAVANHYAKLRSIPASNLVTLDIEVTHKIGVEQFRTQILMPALQAMASRGIGGQIDYLVYSADFPTQIDLTGDGRPEGAPASAESKADPFAPTGSINAMTYLWQLTMTKKPNYMARNVNLYFRHPAGQLPRSTQAFAAWRGWNTQGDSQTEGGMHYYLSTILGVTGVRGNTPAEIVAYLDAASKADGKKPRGTIYYVQSEDKARSGPRQGGFAAAVADLARLGVKGEVLQAQMPIGKADVQGTMMGVAKFDWATSSSRILPGAICDHLTSFGGVMSKGSQSPLTAYLKFGAAGACGAVVEPLNFPDKFPHPNIHVHYASGCSLAEAFYQSIGWPFQILIVGDPLCRPWANIPQVSLEGVKPNARVKGTLTLTPKATVPGSRGIGRFELFVDGIRREKINAGEAFTLNTTELPDGYHELRVVAVESGPIESQGRAIIPFWINNDGKVLALSSIAKRVRFGERVEVKVNSPGASRIVVTYQGNPLGEVKGGAGKITVNTKELGHGPAVIHATAYRTAPSSDERGDERGDKNQKALATAAPIEITVLEK